VFDTFDGTLQTSGETLTLVAPGTNSAGDVTVAKVRYSSAAPWPSGANGAGSSLQLLDPWKDNWRAGNWAGNYPPAALSPGRTNTVLTNLTAFPTLWLNEVQADNLTGITNRAGGRTAWLELYNPSTNVVSLSGLYLANNYSNLTAWAFPTGAVINAGEFKVIFADGQTNLSTNSELHTSFTLTSGTGSLALSRLYNGQPQVLDYLDYASLTPNHSYGSLPDGQGFTRFEFYYVTPGGTNNGASAPLSVVINEWMAGNTHTIPDPISGKYSDWFELYNFGSNTVDLAGYYLSDSLTNRFKSQIPSGYTIPPHGFLLVWADNQTPTGSGDFHASFKLSKNGESIGLYGADGNPVDYVIFGPQTDDISQGRYPDGAGGLFFMPTPTPRTNNVIPNTAPVLAAIASQSLTLGQTLTHIASATDTDQPPQTLTFSLEASTASNATIDAATGLFRWTPATAPLTNSFRIIVADNGSPGLSATQTFVVTVYLPPTVTAQVSGDQVQLVWSRGILQQADEVAGPYFDVPGATSPYAVISSTGRRFFRIRM